MVGWPGSDSLPHGVMENGCTERRPSLNTTGARWPPVRVRKAFVRELAKLQPGWPATVFREGFMGVSLKWACYLSAIALAKADP